MKMSLSFHTALVGLLGILLGLWKQNFLVSTEAVAIALVILPLVPHIMITLWAVYNIIKQIQSLDLCNCHHFKKICFMLKCFRKKSHTYDEIDAGGDNNTRHIQI